MVARQADCGLPRRAAGTPKEIVSLLHRQVATLAALPGVQKRLDASTPDKFAARIKVEMVKRVKVIENAKIAA